jgi:YVTN family beta-propeller protein
MFLGGLVVGAPVVAAADGAPQQRILISGTKSSAIYVIDVARSELIQTIPTDGNPHGFAATKDGRFVWASIGFSTPGKTAIAKIDTATGEIVETHRVPGVDDLELVNDDRHLYIPGFGTGCYFVFDTVAREIVARIETDGLPHNVVAPADDGRFVYLSPMGGTIQEVDRFSDRMGGLKDCHGNPKAVIANDKIYVVDTRTHEPVATIVTGPAPRPVAVTDDGTRLYANVDGLMGIAVLDLTLRKVIERVEYPLSPDEKALASRTHGIWITPDQKEVWSTDVNHDAVFVYDRTTEPLRYVTKVSTGKGPYWISFSPDGKFGYSSNQRDATISVIDVATHKEVARISLPTGSVPKSSIGVTLPADQRYRPPESVATKDQ